MSGFNNIVYDEESGTVEIGVGLTWDQVYERLEPMGIMVAGGRIPGIGEPRVHPRRLILTLLRHRRCWRA